MDYQVSALKWRPQRFEDVVGQDQVTQVIAGAIEQDRVANAYLFSGPRGCGKTTVARILAKALNCEKGPTREPCGECESCKAIAAGRSMAVQERDVASQGSIEDIRDLRERAGYSMLEGRYRVYILDEAHQFKKDAANALLKMLEEPPENVVFVLATTEYDKIIPTIRSRCQRYSFRLLRSEEIAGRIEQIAASEGIMLGEGASMALGRKADGSMRDGLTLFDQVIASLGGKIELDEVIDLLGLPRFENYFTLTDAILARDGAAALKAFDAVLTAGSTPQDFLLGLSQHFRNLLMLNVDPSLLAGELGEEDLAVCKRLAAGFKDEDLLYLTRLSGDRAEQIRRASQPSILAEAFVVELTRYESRVLLSEVMSMLKGGGSADGVGGGGKRATRQPAPATGRKQQDRLSRPKANSPKAPSAAVPSQAANAQAKAAYAISRSGLEAAWPAFVGAVKQSSMIKGQFLDKARPGRVDRQCFTLHLESQFRSLLDNHEDRFLLQDKFREIFGEGRELHLEGPEDEVAPEAPPRVTAARAEDARRDRSMQEHSENALVQELLKKFDGEIVEDR